MKYDSCASPILFGSSNRCAPAGTSASGLSTIRTATCYVAAVVTGLMSSVGLLLFTGIMSGRVAETLRREAWDTDLYWLIGLPLCYLVAGVLGWFGPEHIWRWPLAMMATQALVMLLFSESGLSLLPLGLI